MRPIPLLARRALLARGALGVALLAPGIALCAPASADSGAAAATTVDEIVVTAQKRTQKLEKVPVAISAYTSRQRDLVGIESILDLAKFTPGMDYSATLDRVFIRGVGRQTGNLATQPGVATYFDGVYNASIVAASGDSLFADRIEILRGPQGTLYGKNAIGGTVNAISRRPTDSLYAEARTTLGSYGVYNFEAAVSGPISDAVRFRIAGFRDDQERGYFRNVADQTTNGGKGTISYLEGQLDARIGPSLNGWIKLGVYSWDLTSISGGSPDSYDYSQFLVGSLTAGAPFGFTQPGFTEVGSATQNPGVGNIRTFSNDTPSRSHLTDNYLATAEFTWSTPWAADLKYLGGFTHYDFHAIADADGTSITSYLFPIVPTSICLPAPQRPTLTVFPTTIQEYSERKTYFSNELNLISTDHGRLQWIVGLYQYHEQFHTLLSLVQPSQTQLAMPINAPPNPSQLIYAAEQTMALNSFAGFLQADWQASDTLKVTGGIRYTYDHEGGSETTRLVCFGLPACGQPAGLFGAFTGAIDITRFQISFTPSPGVVGPPTFDAATSFWRRQLSASWRAFSGTAGAEWTPNADTLAYAKYSRGYKSGSFNSGGLINDPETQPEFLYAYEIGVKRTWGKTLQVNAAAFFYNYFGMQIPLPIQPATGPPTTEFFNLKKVVSYGLELEATWRPVADLEVTLSYAYLHATIHSGGACFYDNADPAAAQPGAATTGCPAGGAQNVNGQTLPASPPNKLALNGNYTLRFAPGALTISASLAWQDHTYYSIFNRAYSLAPAYSDVDLRLIWNDARGRFTAIAYAKNVFNTVGYDSAGGAPYVDGSVARSFGLTAPATYGLELQYRFR